MKLEAGAWEAERIVGQLSKSEHQARGLSSFGFEEEVEGGWGRRGVQACLRTRWFT